MDSISKINTRVSYENQSYHKSKHEDQSQFKNNIQCIDCKKFGHKRLNAGPNKGMSINQNFLKMLKNRVSCS